MRNLGLCSVTFRILGHNKIIELCKKAGLKYIEWGEDVHVPRTNLQNAEDVKNETLQNGLKCVSYGSYYKCNGDIDDFREISNVCRILGANTIRVWAGQKDSENVSEKEFNELVLTVKECALIAQKHGQVLAFEFHHGTYCNTPESALKLIKAVNEKNVKTYWQPMYWLVGMEQQERINENKKSIKVLKDYILNVHVYHWVGTNRCPLSDGANEWREYIKILPKNSVYYIEFVMGNTEQQFFNDINTLMGF